MSGIFSFSLENLLSFAYFIQMRPLVPLVPLHLPSEIRAIDAVEVLPPGLYEMIIDAGDDKQGFTDYDVRFEERDFNAIMALNDDVKMIRKEDVDFRRVAAG